MAELDLRQRVIENAKQYLGLKEGDEKHLDILSIYNNYYDPYRRDYKMTTKDPWCMTFVSAMYIKSGCADLIITECSCGVAVARNDCYKQNWQEDDAYVPKAADIIMFDWDDDAEGDCKGWPEHTGLVVSCDGKTIKTIEGNAADSVEYREYPLNGKYIRGFICPDFSSMETAVCEYKSTANVWVRKTPVNGETLVAIPGNTKVKAYSQKWLNVTHRKGDTSYTGWASMLYMRSNISGGYVTTGNVWLRTAPIDGEKIVVIPLNTKLSKNTYPWVKTHYSGFTGWTSTRYLEEI